jgi:hypothetical protein
MCAGVRQHVTESVVSGSGPHACTQLANVCMKHSMPVWNQMATVAKKRRRWASNMDRGDYT